MWTIWWKEKITVRRKRDSQRSRVYDWERQHVDGRLSKMTLRESREMGRNPKMTLDECRALVGEVWRFYFGSESEPPNVKDGRGTRRALAGYFDVSFPRWARTRSTVLHEMAHAILSRSYHWGSAAGGAAPHGPEFVRVYCQLLARFDGRKLGELTRSARACRVKVAAPGVYAPRRRWEDEAECSS